MKLKDSKSEKEIVSERIEDYAVRKVEMKKKARQRTRGPYRQASIKNLPDTS